MENIIFELYKKILQVEYSIRTNILTNISSHINILHGDKLIIHGKMCNYRLQINNIIKSLNLEYNKSFNRIKNMNTKNKLGDIISNINSNVLKVMYYEYISINQITPDEKPSYSKFCVDLTTDKTYLLSIGGLEKYKERMFEYLQPSIQIIKEKNEYILFDQIDNKIKSLVRETGFLNIEDSLIFFLGKKYMEKIREDNPDRTIIEQKFQKHIKLYNTVDFNDLKLESYTQRLFKFFDIVKDNFVPVKSFIIQNNGERGIIIEKKNPSTVVNQDDPKYKYLLLLSNCYKITIKLDNPNLAIINIGYFLKDPHEITLTTSKITNNIIYLKWVYLKKYILKIRHIDNNFKKNYCRNLKLENILAFTKKNIKYIIEKDYNLYLKYINSNFKEIIEYFLKDDLTVKFDMIRVLLFGSKIAIRNAGFLFSLLKDQSIDPKYPIGMSEIVYNNLTYDMQCKLKKIKYYFKEELVRLKNANFNDISLKKQILINTTMPDNIKQYAYTKLNEMKNNPNEHYRYYQIIKCLLEYPWINENTVDIFNSCENNNEQCRKILDKYDNDMKKNYMVILKQLKKSEKLLENG